MIFSIVSIAIGALFLVLFWFRQRSYARHLNYRTDRPYSGQCFGKEVNILEIPFNGMIATIPDLPCGVVSAFLELDVRSSFPSACLDPSIRLNTATVTEVLTLERGCQGRRYVNVSRLLVSIREQGGQLNIQGVNLKVNSSPLRLICSDLSPGEHDRILVVAPHPDDAEIAAFGLYSDFNARVVTLTSGENSDLYQGRGGVVPSFSRSLIARLRVLESLMIPKYGGKVDAVNLCYPDGMLSEMRGIPEHEFSRSEDSVDFMGLRKLNDGRVRPRDQCTWKSLIADLRDEILEFRPTIIVTPHPVLDPHPDHIAATAAVMEVLSDCKITGGTFFFTVVHNRRTELWPFGPAGQGINMPPVFDEDGPCCDGFYSHELSSSRLMEKFAALESMHDLRKMEWPRSGIHGDVFRRLLDDLKSLLNGMGSSPTGYFRRAVRPEELFLSMGYERALENFLLHGSKS